MRGLPVKSKILLCVDDESLGLKVRKMLLEHSGYNVLTAEDGRTGLEVFARSAVDAVVLDFFMPEMDGGMVAKAMKELKPHVPILLLSAYVTLPDGALSSVDAFVTKGQSPEVLLEKIRELVGE
jgi:CheY-like chemotaxis protein